MYFIYILHSESADKYYVGHTDDYIQRLNDHNTQDYFNTYTSKHRPWKMKAVFACGTSRSDALKIEKFIKKQKNRRFIENAIIINDIPFLRHLLIRSQESFGPISRLNKSLR